MDDGPGPIAHVVVSHVFVEHIARRGVAAAKTPNCDALTAGSRATTPTRPTSSRA
jgi:hypothetical protein